MKYKPNDLVELTAYLPDSYGQLHSKAHTFKVANYTKSWIHVYQVLGANLVGSVYSFDRTNFEQYSQIAAITNTNPPNNKSADRNMFDGNIVWIRRYLVTFPFHAHIENFPKTEWSQPDCRAEWPDSAGAQVDFDVAAFLYKEKSMRDAMVRAAYPPQNRLDYWPDWLLNGGTPVTKVDHMAIVRDLIRGGS